MRTGLVFALSLGESVIAMLGLSRLLMHKKYTGCHVRFTSKSSMYVENEIYFGFVSVATQISKWDIRIVILVNRIAVFFAPSN